MVYYIDTSAFVKTFVDEPNSSELVSWVQSMDPEFVSSGLLRIETLRSARRIDSRVIKQAREALRSVHFIALSRYVCELAADLELAVLRSLDAAHVASALSVGEELEAVITYDQRLAEACGELGLTVVAPGAESSS